MSNIRELRQALIARILDGAGQASQAQRREAFDNAGLTEPLRSLVDKVGLHASQISDEDVARVGASGLSEDQIFELVICSAIGQAARQQDLALSALGAACEEE
jgi:hypothetical protein